MLSWRNGVAPNGPAINNWENNKPQKEQKQVFSTLTKKRYFSRFFPENQEKIFLPFFSYFNPKFSCNQKYGGGTLSAKK